MSQSRQLRRLQKRLKEKDRQKGVVHDVAISSKKRFPLPLLVGALLSTIVVFTLLKTRQGGLGSASVGDLPKIEDLVKMTDDQIADIGIARVNLACAQGLGKATETAKFLRTLDQMAAAAWTTTTRNQHRFVENPAEYENSEIYYKVGMLVTVLGQDLGVHYNREKIQTPAEIRSAKEDRFFDNADDVFVSGLLGEARQGTCSSMPVLCVAVGRKLGYPLKLASAKGHLFFRWDDGKQKMNFENTNKFSSSSDEYYKTWPHPMTDDELKQGVFLQSLTPRQELAVFLSIRGSVLRFQGRINAAYEAFVQANKIHPHPGYQLAIRSIQSREAAATRPKVSAAEEQLQRENLLAAVEAIEMSRPPRQRSELPPDVTPPNPLHNSPFPPRPIFPQPVKSTLFRP
jgi:hypothetical protein